MDSLTGHSKFAVICLQIFHSSTLSFFQLQIKLIVNIPFYLLLPNSKIITPATIPSSNQPFCRTFFS